jgi:hypothetical protein
MEAQPLLVLTARRRSAVTEKGTTVSSLSRAALAAFLAAATVPPTARAGEPPVIPVGADAYLQWERWP